MNVIDLNYSPIKGPEGNIEYLIFIDRFNKGLNKRRSLMLLQMKLPIAHMMI